MYCILRYTRVLSKVPRDYKQKLDVELDLGFHCFMRHMMVQGELPSDQKLDVGIFLLFLTYNEVPRDYKRKLDVELDVGFSCFL